MQAGSIRSGREAGGGKQSCGKHDQWEEFRVVKFHLVFAG